MMVKFLCLVHCVGLYGCYFDVLVVFSGSVTLCCLLLWYLVLHNLFSVFLVSRFFFFSLNSQRRAQRTCIPSIFNLRGVGVAYHC